MLALFERDGISIALRDQEMPDEYKVDLDMRGDTTRHRTEAR